MTSTLQDLTRDIQWNYVRANCSVVPGPGHSHSRSRRNMSGHIHARYESSDNVIWTMNIWICFGPKLTNDHQQSTLLCDMLLTFAVIFDFEFRSEFSFLFLAEITITLSHSRAIDIDKFSFEWNCYFQLVSITKYYFRFNVRRHRNSFIVDGTDGRTLTKMTNSLVRNIAFVTFVASQFDRNYLQRASA